MLPVRSVPTFIELLVGAMITQAGFVTEVWLAINPVRSWNAYCAWLQHGKWSWVALGIQMTRLMVTCFLQPIRFIIFYDTFICRCSKKPQEVLSITNMGTKPIGLNMHVANVG